MAFHHGMEAIGKLPFEAGLLFSIIGFAFALFIGSSSRVEIDRQDQTISFLHKQGVRVTENTSYPLEEVEEIKIEKRQLKGDLNPGFRLLVRVAPEGWKPVNKRFIQYPNKLQRVGRMFWQNVLRYRGESVSLSTT
ncbi:MAG: hypothetical protein AAF399_29945 [Bacteroidota bacterium]